MIKDRLHIDQKDILLMSLLMENPDISQSDLADKLSLSQPSVNVRMRKLKSRGVLAQSIGLDAKRGDFSMVRVDCTCSDADKLLRVLKRCSFFVNGFLMSGTRNISIFLIGEDLFKIEQIVKQYLRKNSSVSNIELSVVVEMAKEFICAVDLAKEHSMPCSDPESCKDCSLVHDMK